MYIAYVIPRAHTHARPNRSRPTSNPVRFSTSRENAARISFAHSNIRDAWQALYALNQKNVLARAAAIAVGIGARARAVFNRGSGGRAIRPKDWWRIGSFSNRPVTYRLSEMPAAASGTSRPIEKAISIARHGSSSSTEERAQFACARLQVCSSSSKGRP